MVQSTPGKYWAARVATCPGCPEAGPAGKVILAGGAGFEIGGLDRVGAGPAGRAVVGVGDPTGVDVGLGAAVTRASGVAARVATAEVGEVLGPPPPTP